MGEFVVALTYSPKNSADFFCPDFTKKNLDGRTLSLNDFSEFQVLVFLFICNHCPYVKAIEERIIKLAAELKAKEIQVIGVCSNDAGEHPEDSFENLRQSWQEKNYNFPYLYDADQSMAKAFGAVCTPDIFVFDRERKLQYRGRFDDSWKDPGKVKNQELKNAALAILQKGSSAQLQHPSMGCSIKWL